MSNIFSHLGNENKKYLGTLSYYNQNSYTKKEKKNPLKTVNVVKNRSDWGETPRYMLTGCFVFVCFLAPFYFLNICVCVFECVWLCSECVQVHMCVCSCEGRY